MATLDETLEAVRDANTKADSLIVYVQGIKQQLDDALSGVLKPEDQAKVDAIFAEAQAQAQETADAIDEGTTEEPPAP